VQIPEKSFLFQAARKTNTLDGKELPAFGISAWLCEIAQCPAADVPFLPVPEPLSPLRVVNNLPRNPTRRHTYTGVTGRLVA
jgi:hypothetical protein